MQRNKYTEREKKWLAIQRITNELHPYKLGGTWMRRRRQGWVLEPNQEYILWEPLERPVFAGWDMWVTLGEPGLRRRDAVRLLTALRYLGVDKPSFIREVKYLKLARKAGYRYPQVEVAWTPPGGRNYIYYPLGHLFNRKVSEKVYMSMPADIKCYFQRNARYNRWSGKDDIEYALDWRFPTQELVVKVKKAYNTHIGHLYGDQIGEYEKLNDWLYSHATVHERATLHGYNSYNNWDNKCRKHRIRGSRARWKAALREIRSDDDQEVLERKYKLFMGKNFNYT